MALRFLGVQFRLGIVRFHRDTASDQPLVYRRPDCASLRKHEDVAGWSSVRDHVSNGTDHSYNFCSQRSVLDDADIARPIFGTGRKCAGHWSIDIMGNEMACHLHHRRWTTAAFIKAQVIRARPVCKPIANAIWMSVLEAVDRLIVVPNDADFSIIRKKINHPLFGPVQVLILIDENM